MHLTIKERVELVLMSGADGATNRSVAKKFYIVSELFYMLWCVIYGPKRLLLLSELFYMLWCVIYGPKRLLLLSELFYMLWCVIYGPPCIFFAN